MALHLAQLTAELGALAEHYDAHPAWPQRSMDHLARVGGWRWAIPKKWGGAALDSLELLQAYEAVAHGCVATALILTQRDGACDLIARGENEALKRRLLRAYARAERFTSIGIAQLTTSRRGRKPALTARPSGDGYMLDGVMPWVTGAEQCDEIVTGAVLPDGRQILACVSCDNPAVTVEPPLKLMALSASCTSRVRCVALRLTPDDLIRGPTDLALSMRAPVKPLVVSAVGIGLAGAFAQRLTDDAGAQPFQAQLKPVLNAYTEARARLFEAAATKREGEAHTDFLDLRVRINDLVARLAMAYLTISRGTGYAHPHPAERLLREAMFLLVWSAPTEVQAGTLGVLANEASRAAGQIRTPKGRRRTRRSGATGCESGG